MPLFSYVLFQITVVCIIVRRLACLWNASGSGSPLFLIPALWNIGILLHKQAKWRTIMHATVCNQVTVKSTVEILQNFVAFSECMNFIYNDFGGSIPNVTVHVSYVYNSLLLPYTTAQCVLPKLSRSTGRNWIGQYLWDTLCSVFPDDVRLPVQDLLPLTGTTP